MKINNPKKGEIFLNGNRIKESLFDGKFYSEFSLPISIYPNVGFTSKGYLYDTISAKSGDSLIIDISFIRNKESEKQVIINEIDYVNDCFEIFNQGDEDISLDGWKVVDKNHNIYTIKEGVLKKNRFLVFHNKTIENRIDSVDYFKIDFKLSSSSESLKIYDNQEGLVDSISYNLIDIESSYSRSIPFEDIENATVTWENNSDFTIGYHNESYTSLMYDRDQEELQKKKERKILFISVGVVALLPLLFLIRKRE